MVRSSKAHVILICEAEVWNFTRNILRSLVGLMQKIFCCLAGLGEEGSIQQIAGSREDYASKFVPDKRGKSRMQSLSSSGERPYQGKSLLHPAGDIFFTRATELGDYGTCRMAATRTCVCHVNNEDAGKSHAIAGEWLAAIYECFVRPVATISDANKMAHQRQGQQLNCS